MRVYVVVRVLTFFGDHVDHSVLINKSHAFQSSLTHTRNGIRTSDTSFSASCCVQQCRLEVRIKLGIKFAIVAEHDTDSFIRIDDTKFEIGAEGML